MRCRTAGLFVGLPLMMGAACSSARTTGVAAPVERATLSAQVVGETVVDPIYRQGVARAANGWAFSFNDGLFLTDDAFTKTAELMPAIPDEWKARGFDHLGDIDIVDGLVYAPLEQPEYDKDLQAMLIYDATTLQYRDGVAVTQHQNSFVTVDADTGIAYSMDYFGGDVLLRYDTRDNWRALDPLPLSTFVDRVQGGDLYGGAVWLSTDDDTDGVYRVDLADGSVQSLGSIGHADGEGEGIDATPRPSGDLHVLSADVAIVPMRLIELRVTTR
jgi:hypothetical protein